jgi:hypothetical protein
MSHDQTGSITPSEKAWIRSVFPPETLGCQNPRGG